MDRLRIVHCFRSPVGGIFRHVRDLVEEQAGEGHAVGIVCDSSTGSEFEDRLFDELGPLLESRTGAPADGPRDRTWRSGSVAPHRRDAQGVAGRT